MKTAKLIKQLFACVAMLSFLAAPAVAKEKAPSQVLIKKGAYADLLIVDGNPLEDIKLLGDPAKNLKLIIKDGKVYKNAL